MKTACAFVLVTLVTLGNTLTAQSLKGSMASVNRQYEVAREEDFTRLPDVQAVNRFVESDLLVELRGNSNYNLHDVSHPYTRPTTKLFVDRFSGQFRSACGEKLGVTSATRTLDNQPRNASPRSVHPTGMSVDLRVPETGKCQRWLERTLLSLEKKGVIEATRERRPPHYHVAVFPTKYQAYVDNKQAPKPAKKRRL